MAAQAIEAWDGRIINVRSSCGQRAVKYVERWQDNVLPCPSGTWPSWLERQVRSYVARATWFSPEEGVTSVLFGLGLLIGGGSGYVRIIGLI